MSAINEPPDRWPPQQLRRKSSGLSIGHRSTNSSDSRTSSAPPSPTSPAPSPRAIEISAAFERVRQRSTKLETALLESSAAATRDCVKKFQDAVAGLFQELNHLPDDVTPTPVLISAIQGCSFEILCFESFVERYRLGYEGWEEGQKELAMMLNEAMASMCILLELAAQAIEEAEAERNRLEESELGTNKAGKGSSFGSGLSTEDRPNSWLVPVDDPVSGRPVSSSESGRLVSAHSYSKELRRQPSLAGHLKKVSLTDLKKPHEPSPPPTPNQPAFSRKEPLIPTKRPNKGKYDTCHLRKFVHHHHEDSPLPLRDSLAMIGHSAPFPADLPKPDPDDLQAPYVEYNPDKSLKKANLRGLVGVITSGSAIEHEEFVSMVLTTFRLFTSGQKLADALYFRYTEQRPEWLARKGKMRFEWSMAQRRMKARVATILHLWLELHWKPEDLGALVRLHQLIGVVEEDCVFHAQSLRMSFDRIVEDLDYHGRRFRKEERYRSTIAPPISTLFAARNDLATLATRDSSAMTLVRFATPEGVIEFARMVTMVESRYYRKLSPEDFVHYKSPQTLKLRKELGDFEQRYKAWIVWTIVTPEDPIERAHVIEFWFEVAKVRGICPLFSLFEDMRLTCGM